MTYKKLLAGLTQIEKELNDIIDSPYILDTTWTLITKAQSRLSDGISSIQLISE